MKLPKIRVFYIFLALLLAAGALLVVWQLNAKHYDGAIVFDVTVKKIETGGKRDIEVGDRCELHIKKLVDSADSHLGIFCGEERFLWEDDTSLNIWEDEADGVYYYRVTGRDGVGHSDHVRRGFTIDSNRRLMFLHPVYNRLGDISDPEGPWFVEWEMATCSHPHQGKSLFPGGRVRVEGAYHLGDPEKTYLFQTPLDGVRCPMSE